MAKSGSAQWLKLFPGKPFYLQSGPKFPSKCDVCCMNVEGSMYYCEDGDIVVHQECDKLDEKIFMFVGGNAVEFNLCKAEAESNCMKCKRVKPEGSLGDIKGFHYESGDKTRTLHVSCYNGTHNPNTDSKTSPFPIRWKILSSVVELHSDRPSAPCSMCCMMMNGWMYQSVDKESAFHLECAMLKEKILLKEGEKDIELQLCPWGGNFKCVYCRELKPEGSQGNIPGYCYESPSMNRTLHVSCFIKYRSAAKKPNNNLTKYKLGDGVLSMFSDAVFEQGASFVISVLSGGFSPI